MRSRPGGWLTERTERIPDTENEFHAFQARRTEVVHSFRKRRRRDILLAQRVSWVHERRMLQRRRCGRFLRSKCLDFPNRRKLHRAFHPRHISGPAPRITISCPCLSAYTPNFSFFAISAAIFSISAWINPFVANIVLPPSR